ncbi:hypothetical protein M3I54_37335 [Paraburkholderia sp. CNPSo 3274]|uniref:hypothetical protein n=1 Tax=Paraburkholderia sp. CNPSo 3274 TaxID=2940932 RepID=UPI0020B708CC|nr:hypothetical protein [Paraburkholderia sp. CNPSo 3274]MCP3712520.1 hypothetical protein [Paraburkholderia sp. CNPSo 3274]
MSRQTALTRTTQASFRSAQVGLDIGVLFVHEHSEAAYPLSAKGVREICVAGVAAVANAEYNATGKRVRELPITLEKLLQAQSGAATAGASPSCASS